MLLHTHIHTLFKHGKTFSKNTIAIVQQNSIPTIVTKILFYKVAVWEPKGGFPLSRNFYVRTDVNFNWLYVRKIK